MVPFDRGSLLLAPMVGITNRAFATLLSELGPPDFRFTEMASAEAFEAKAKYEEYYTDPKPEPSRTSIQFFARSSRALGAACAMVAARAPEERPAGIDINFGCSAPHIRRAGGGSAWSADPEGAVRLVEAARSAWTGSLSAKIRLGQDDDYERLFSFCLSLAEAGLDFISIHPRTDSQKFRKAARHDLSLRLASDLPVPVVANGDIEDAGTAKALIAGGAHSVMIGRGAARRPWIFSRLHAELSGGPSPGPFDRRAAGSRYLELVDRFLPDPWKLGAARSFFSYYCDTFSFAHHIKFKVLNCPDLSAMKLALEEYYLQVPADAASDS